MPDAAAQMVEWARFGVAHHGTLANTGDFVYSENPAVRQLCLHYRPGQLPVACDCSIALTLWAYWAGVLRDPNGLPSFQTPGTRYTGTLLASNPHIPIQKVRPGDPIVYGPGTGVHTALVVDPNNGDPLTVSMGRPGAPELVYVSQDGRQPQTYLRLNTEAKVPVGPGGPVKPGVPGRPPGPLPVLYWHVNNPPWVNFLHRCLQMPLPRRGGFGWATFHRVVKFQTANHLPATGVVDAGTWQALDVR